MTNPAPSAPAFAPWWTDAVIYQIYPRSWADSNGDGIGDLPGITARLPHLATLGVDAVWLSPFYTSPQNDAGYDVANYRDIDHLFGTLADFDALAATAHDLGLRVIVDLVPNHSSSEHEWFQAALASPPGSAERARYVFRDGAGDGSEPPNNWVSNFGGPAWTRITEADGKPGQWYLHLFDTTQPDFDWTNPDIADEFDDILRFWLDRGVDGFRIDVAHGLVKTDGLPDRDPEHRHMVDPTADEPMWDQPGVHDIYRRWRRIAEEYRIEGKDADRILCAEAWVTPSAALAQYVRPDELHQSFNFAFLGTAWNAPALRAVIHDSLTAAQSVGAPQTWVLSNHDVVRHASRLAFEHDPAKPVLMDGIGIGDPQPDAVLGLVRARAATALMLALPGSAYLYQGEELGLPEATEIPDELRQDPTWESSGHTRRGRDGCRVPVPWEGDEAPFGFSSTAATWLPQPAEYGNFTPDNQLDDPASTLSLYIAALRLRRELRLGRGELTWVGEFGENAVTFRNELAGRGDVLVIANIGKESIELPPGRLLLTSSAEHVAGQANPDETVWIGLS